MVTRTNDYTGVGLLVVIYHFKKSVEYNTTKIITIVFIAKISQKQGPSGSLAQQPLDDSSVVLYPGRII